MCTCTVVHTHTLVFEALSVDLVVFSNDCFCHSSINVFERMCATINITCIGVNFVVFPLFFLKFDEPEQATYTVLQTISIF